MSRLSMMLFIFSQFLRRVMQLFFQIINFFRLFSILFETLSEIKRETDSKILINNDMINNSNFFEKTVLQSVANNFANRIDSFETATANKINNIIVKEYFEENIFS